MNAEERLKAYTEWMAEGERRFGFTVSAQVNVQDFGTMIQATARPVIAPILNWTAPEDQLKEINDA